jgi:DNA-binding LacI/PurR family transcriptional regulator
MTTVPRCSLVQQTAEHLRAGFRDNHWHGKVPGVIRLAGELGVSKETVRAALHELEKEGALRANGAGKRRELVANSGEPARRIVRVAILLAQPLENENGYSQRLFLTIKHSVEAMGHECFFASQSLWELDAKPRRVARMVDTARADAWIVYAGTRPVLEWFAMQGIPTLAVGGRAEGLAIEWTRADLKPPMEAAVDTLAALGHRRMVLLCPGYWRKPDPGPPAAAFLARLAHWKIPVSDYHLPDWEVTPEGLKAVLEALFFATPPTALLTLTPDTCDAALAFLANRRLRIPEDVSIVCLMSDAVFKMRLPPLAHFEWPMQGLVRQAVRWAKSVAAGHPGRHARTCPATFIPGGTIAPPRK